MTEISRVRAVWTGFLGAPGVSTFFFLDTATAVASVHSFFSNLQTFLPNDVDIQVENVGDVIEDTTGALVGSWSADSVASVAGANSGTYAAPAGAVVDWNTDTIGPHRRIRGRTFIVPLAGEEYQEDGSLGSTCRAGIQSSADDLVTSQSTSFVIWHRGTGGAGSNGLVVSAYVPDMVAILRSRRD